MPELPEVEFARGCLERWLKGKKLARVEADQTRVTRGSPAPVSVLGGHTLRKVERTGKWLLWSFDSDLGVLAHLGMTGKYVLQHPGEPDVKSSRVRFVRSDGVTVHYQDPRMFGRVSAGPIAELREDPGYATLGPDAWNAPLSPKALCEALHSRKRAVKDVLMDQTIQAGAGNIQATEALFRARVHPARPSASLTPKECKAITDGLHWSLERTLKMNKGDKITYVEESGAHENPFLVYGKEGEPCPRCGTTLRTSKIAGRTSAFCPHCQPLRPEAKAAARPRDRRE